MTFWTEASRHPREFAILSWASVWRALELDYLIAVSPRVASILRGGSEAAYRRARLPELEVCRAALMADMLFRRLDSSTTSHAGGVRELCSKIAAWG